MEAGRTKTEAEQVDFFDRCYERFLRATHAVGEVRHFYRIGGETVCLLFAGESLVPLVTPALEHLRTPAIHHADLTLCVWDSRSTSTEMVPAPCEPEYLTDRGEIWGFDSQRIKAAFNWDEGSVHLMDHAKRTGIYWVHRAETIPYWAKAAPLRTLFHWEMERNGCQLLHAAAVGNGKRAALMTGKGGIGKSTTALACLRSGLGYLADDYLIVRLEPEPIVYSLYCTAKLNADSLVHFPEFRSLVQNSQKLDREKAVLYLYPHFEGQIVREMPVTTILIPQLAESGETRFTPAPTSEIHRATSFTTMSQLPHVGRHTHDFIRRLSARVPGYTLEMNRDLNDLSRAVADFLEGPGNGRREHRIALNRTGDTDQKPLVTVIVPVFNGERFVEEAIDNILSQGYPALELIVVDDGSTDTTAELISHLPSDIRYFKQDNAGPAAARNRGIKDASGEFIAFLDVDDLWPENTLNHLVDELVRDPELDVIHGYDQVMTRNPQSGTYEYAGNPKEAFPFSIAAGVYRKSVFGKVGLFDPTLLFGEDTDWFMRVKEVGAKIRRVEDVTLLVRRHGQNMTRGRDLVELNTLRVFKKALDRKRVREARAKDNGG